MDSVVPSIATSRTRPNESISLVRIPSFSSIRSILILYLSGNPGFIFSRRHPADFLKHLGKSLVIIIPYRFGYLHQLIFGGCDQLLRFFHPHLSQIAHEGFSGHLFEQAGK